MNREIGKRRTWIDERAALHGEIEDARKRMNKLAQEYVDLRHMLTEQQNQGLAEAAKRSEELLAKKAKQYQRLKEIIEFNS